MLSTMQKPPHIVAVSETKINKNDGLSFSNTITGYNVLHSMKKIRWSRNLH